MTNANELAFPLVHSDGDDTFTHGGLTKRELFAAMDDTPIPEDIYKLAETPDQKAMIRACWKVKMADALIKALNDIPNV